MSDTALDAIQFLRDAAIAADTDLGSRIYMSIAPQSAQYPLAVMEIVSRTESPTQDSGSAVDTYRIQVDVYAKQGARSAFDQASTIANDLRVAWSRGSDFVSYDNGIDGVQEVGYFSDFDPELQCQRVSNDYMVRVLGAGTDLTMATIIKRTKVTLDYTDFSDASASKTVNLFTLPAGGIVHGIAINATTVFDINSLQLGVGVGSEDDYNKYISVLFPNTETNDTPYFIQEMGVTSIESMAVDTVMTITATCSLVMLNTLTQGEVDIWIYYSILNQ